MKHVKLFEKFLNEKRPEWQDSDFPDAEGRFAELSPKDLAAWLIKTRKKDLKAISGSLTQQVVFNRNEDPKYAEKMEKTRKEVYKQLGRQDLLDKMDENKQTIMKHIKLFERFITDSDVTRWEREHGKLPIPKEISAIAKDMLKAGFIRKDTTLTQAKLWIALEDASWTEMEKKFGKLVGKFYGGEFYNEMSDVISIKAAYYAYEVSKSIQDKVANGEDVEPAYYELKAYFNAFGMDYNRSRIFNGAVSKLEEWMKINKLQ